jgi:hypothetical protein
MVDRVIFSKNFIDHLIFKYEHWMLEHGKDNEEIDKFIEWCKKEEQEYLNVPRAPDGKSFLERIEKSI